ncbi:hypothetical protein [Cytobacillus oceanisediminis]|uniref:hypothetical protein n=1 Tax=Cytobacillus oceanisediminis TaxID=665099 RepID=UPI001FB50483|nr:hypothetical protein [Cytobacillus oceanisediminis]UOE58158.1 hypothetical protein IRB79_27005 [Cytobacillus oceanisediminis]
MTDKDKNQLDLFGNLDTNNSNLWGTAGSSDPFGSTGNDDPFAGIPFPEPPKAEEKLASTLAAVIPIKPGADKAEPVKNEDKKTETAKAPDKNDKKTAAKATSKDKKKKKEDIQVDESWTVAYAGNQLSPSRPMKLEELREELELDYPELSKERTRMEANEERKLVVPIVSGAKNG